MSSTKQQPADKAGNAKASKQAKMPPRRSWLWFVLILIANYFLLKLLIPGPAEITIPYTVFKEEVGKGNVEAIYSRGETITGRFAQSVTFPPPAEQSEGNLLRRRAGSPRRRVCTKARPKRRPTSRPPCPPS